MNLQPKDELLYGQACGLWGSDAQLLMLVEECAELQQAVMHLRRDRVSVDDVAGELADVLIMVEQVTCILFAHDAVDGAKAAKLQRLRERVAKAQLKRDNEGQSR